MTEPEHPQKATWVRSQYLPDGTYVIGFNVGDDVTWSLMPAAAIRYATGLVAAATAAEHDAAVVASLRARDIPEELIGHVVADVRERRPGWDKATRPLHLEPGVSLFTGAPFLHVRTERAQPWQWSPADARNHAMGVLRVVTATEEDNRLHEALAEYGLAEESIAAVIDSLSEHWPAAGDYDL